MPSYTTYRLRIKPFFDYLLAGVMLVSFSPLFFLISIIIFCAGEPVFFVHKRPGKGCRLFGMMKFTTIRAGGEPFRFGGFLRKTSLDELPQLINILRGEMSFIGPRPLLESYLKMYNKDQLKRHEVKPGITGWAQVHGRNTLSLDEKLKYDIEYVTQMSFLMDLKIWAMTCVQLFRFSESDYHKVQPNKPIKKQKTS